MENKKKILVDVDGTIADIHALFTKRVSDEFNTDFSVEDIKGWGFEGKAAELGLSTRACIDLLHKLWVDNWESVALLDASVGAVFNTLKQKYKIDIVTASAVPEIINKWIIKNNIPHDSFIAHGSKHELDYDFYIEDNPNLHDKLKPGQMLMLYDRPWNRKVPEKKNVVRFNKFNQVINILEASEKSLLE